MILCCLVEWGKGISCCRLWPGSVFLLSFLLVLNGVAQGVEERVHPWRKYLRNFRREHHFALSAGSGQGSWKIGRFGSLEDKTQASSSVWLKARYSFHIQLYRGLGYFLGTSTGYAAQRSRGDFSAPSSWHLPGLTSGITYNLSPEFRFLLFQEVYLERFEGLSGSDNTRLDASMLCPLDGAFGIDYFFHLNYAIRAEVHVRKAFYNPPGDSVDQLLPEGGRFEKWERCFGVGLVVHSL